MCAKGCFLKSPVQEGVSSPAITFDRSTSQQIFEYIRGEIIRMDLVPGAKIPENSLAEKFQVSRTPVRAALQQLQAQGLVEVRPQRGTFVTKLKMAHILEARFIREALEIAVASHLAEHHEQALIDECEDILAGQVEAAKNEDSDNFQLLDDSFHAALAKATGFERVDKVIEAEKTHMDRVRRLSLFELSGQYEQVINQHRAILAAIKSGSSEKAKHAMQGHMRDVYNILKIAPQNHPEYFL